MHVMRVCIVSVHQNMLKCVNLKEQGVMVYNGNHSMKDFMLGSAALPVSPGCSQISQQAQYVQGV